ncbi:hypothetical protein Tco_0980000 [Tanacetum coccineum]
MIRRKTPTWVSSHQPPLSTIVGPSGTSRHTLRASGSSQLPLISISYTHLSDHIQQAPLLRRLFEDKLLLVLLQLRTKGKIGGKAITEDRPATAEPAWSIPSSDLPVLMNNRASALASTYAPPPENSLLARPVTPDVGSRADGTDQMWIKRNASMTSLAMYGICLIVVLKDNASKLTDTLGVTITEDDRLLYRADLNEYLIAERDFKIFIPSDFDRTTDDMRFNEIHKFSDGHFYIQIERHWTTGRQGIKVIIPTIARAGGILPERDSCTISIVVLSMFPKRSLHVRNTGIVRTEMELGMDNIPNNGTSIEGLCKTLKTSSMGTQCKLAQPSLATQDPSKDSLFHFSEINTFLSSLSLREILLKMNLPDHRSVLTDPEDQAKIEMETPRSSGVNSPPNAHT